jgi:hypothetical protein
VLWLMVVVGLALGWWVSFHKQAAVMTSRIKALNLQKAELSDKLDSANFDLYLQKRVLERRKWTQIGTSTTEASNP